MREKESKERERGSENERERERRERKRGNVFLIMQFNYAELLKNECNFYKDTVKPQ